MTRWLVLILAGLLPMLFGCGSDGPPTVRYGEEACAQCRMIINDERFAAASALKSGETLKFDDVVCLVEHFRERPDDAKAHWIRSYEGGQWLDATTAHYVYGPQLQTPMASGMAALATSDEVASLAQEWNGQTLRFTELSDFFQKRRAEETEAAATPAATSNSTTAVQEASP